MSNRPRILIVEDERPHQLIVGKALGGTYELVFAGSVAEAKQIISQQDFDVFLLDIMLGDGEGFEVLTYLRNIEKFQLTPVVFLTAREDLKSKLLGFSLGGDDYVTKPCEALELRARIDAKLRMMSELRDRGQSQESLKFGDLTMDVGRQAVFVHEAGVEQQLDLTPLEFRLLLCFSRHIEKPLTRQQILSEVWGQQTHVLDRSVDSYVAALRKKLGERGKYIKSVHGIGYRFQPTSASNQRAS